MSDRWVFHALGGEGDPYPTLIRCLTTATGCYVIRSKSTKKVLYVGSSKGALYSTITRHFQGWRRKKKWFATAGYSKAHDPGVTYKRDSVEVAVQVMHKGADHLKREAELIEHFEPHDNLVEHPDGGGKHELEDAPF